MALVYTEDGDCYLTECPACGKPFPPQANPPYHIEQEHGGYPEDFGLEPLSPAAPGYVSRHVRDEDVPDFRDLPEADAESELSARL